jgi:mRNA interferase RelE/StbE
VPYRIVYMPAAGRDMDRLPRHILPRVRDAILPLAENPRPPKSKMLEGSDGAWRLRVGDYRVVYEVDDARRLVTVTRARHRSDVYR